MSKNLLAKHYQKDKEILKEKAREKYKNLSKEEKEKKSNNMVVNRGGFRGGLGGTLPPSLIFCYHLLFSIALKKYKLCYLKLN